MHRRHASLAARALVLVLCVGVALAACGAQRTPSTGAHDANVDAYVDAGLDASVDPEVDAGVDGSLHASVDASVDASDAAPVDAFVEDLDMQAADFECLLRWAQVGRYRLTNRLGYEAEALAVANDPDGGVFPVGTILQLVPGEAMVKRRRGFSAFTRDWEFFQLTVSASGTTIVDRGTTDVANTFGGPCITCHSAAAPEFDLVCGQTHGCAPLSLSAAQITSLQTNDPRCP